MQRQKSFDDELKAILYLVATPIGNLEDITFRAIKILNEVDTIYAEDTRTTRVLLSHYAIKKPLFSYYEFGDKDKSSQILNQLAQGKKVAIVSDAGMPIISDPGFEITKKCIDLGISVVIIPGANAALSGLVVSGLNPHPFIFCGFLSNKTVTRKKQLDNYKTNKETLIFYESPHRIRDFLEDAFIIFGDRKMCLAREITKKFEEIIRGNISEIVAIEEDLKGEMVVIIEGVKESDYSGLSIDEHIGMYIKVGIDSKEAIKRVASERRVTKQVVYKHYHKVE